MRENIYSHDTGMVWSYNEVRQIFNETIWKHSRFEIHHGANDQA